MILKTILFIIFFFILTPLGYLIRVIHRNNNINNIKEEYRTNSNNRNKYHLYSIY